MRASDRTDLLSVLAAEVSEVAARGSRMLVTTHQVTKGPNSALASWDRYFTDLSFGSYTPLVRGERRIARSRAWHFALKNMALVDIILRDERQELNVLDVGCASGYLRRFLEGNLPGRERKLVRYWGLDARLESLRSAVFDTKDPESGAAGRLTPSLFVHHDLAFGLPFMDTSFDWVVAFESLKYLDQDTGPRVLKGIRRVCRQGARFILSMPTGFEYEREVHPGRMSALDPNEFTDLLLDTGFAVDSVRGSQSTFEFIDAVIRDDHREAFDLLAAILPQEVVAAFFTPLYPRHSTQLTYICQPI